MPELISQNIVIKANQRKWCSTQAEKNGAAAPQNGQSSVQITRHGLERSTLSHREAPHSLDAEKGILCAILNRPAAVLPIAQQFLSPDHFYFATHRTLFEAMCTRFNDEGMFDLVTLTTHLIDVGQINSVGGPGYVTELFTFGAIPENASHYIDILKDKYAKRSIIHTATQAIQRAYAVDEQGGGGPADIFDELFVGLEQVRAGLRSNLRLPDLRDMSLFLGPNLPPEPPELVKGLLHQGSKVVVGGTSKGRKTMALVDMGVSVCAGTDWWGFPCAKGPVCYINFEIQDPFMCKRVNAVCVAKGVKLPPDQFMAWNLRGHGEGIENLVADLMAVLRHRRFVLIIIDPIYKALGDRDENKAGDVASMLNQLEKIAVKTGAAVAFGAHYSKGNQSLKEAVDRIGGSGVFARDPDSILTMTAHEEEEAFTVDATLRNFAPIKPFVVRWESPLFYRDEDLDPDNLKQARKANTGQFEAKYTDGTLLSELSVIHGIRPRVLLNRLSELKGISRSQFYKLALKLRQGNLIIERDGEWFRSNGKAPTE